MRLLLLSIFLFSIFGCRQQKQVSEEEELYKEVIEIHDELMPEMQTIFSLRKALQTKKDSIKNVDANDETLAAINYNIEELTNANESMMQWMRAFNPKYEGNEDLTKLEYLKIEKEKINQVSQDFHNSINNARQTLQVSP